MNSIGNFAQHAVSLVLAGALAIANITAVRADDAPTAFGGQAHAAVPDIGFVDKTDQAVSLTDFRGKLVLLHLWATWCAPCIHELPALDELQAKFPDIEVIAIALDDDGAIVVPRFYAAHGIEHLEIYVGHAGELLTAMHAPGLPVSLLIDAKGQQVGRHAGVVQWDAPGSVAFFREWMESNRSRSP